MPTLALVSIESMNTVHQEELALVHTLLQHLAHDEVHLIATDLDTLLAHMQKHFEGEEERMKTCQYPSFRMHKTEHDKVLQESRYAEMEWRNRKDREALREYYEEVLTWLDQHIKAMDRPMADFVSQFEKYRGY